MRWPGTHSSVSPQHGAPLESYGSNANCKGDISVSNEDNKRFNSWLTFFADSAEMSERVLLAMKSEINEELSKREYLKNKEGES